MALSELRSLAEERLKNKHLTTQHSLLNTTPSPEEALGLAHELDVCKIELEIQQEILVQRTNELENSLTRFTQALEASRAGVWEWDVNTGENIWSDELWSLFGLKRSAAKPSFELWTDIIHPDDREIAIQTVLMAADNAQTLNVEFRVCFPDGTVHWILSRGKPLHNKQGEVDRYIGTVIDITERKQTEDALKKQNERFASLFDNMLNGIAYCCMLFEEGRPVDFIYEQVNPSFEKLTGLRQVEGKRVSELITGIHQIQPEILELYGRVARTGQPERVELYVSPLMIWLDISAYSVQKDHFVAVFENITERKKAEQLVVEGRTTLEAALTSMSDAFFICDTTGNFTHFNEAFAIFHRFRNKEECATTFDEYPKFIEVYLITGELVTVDNWPVQRALRGETGTGVEFRVLRKDSGETWFASYNYAPIRNKEGLIIGSVVTCRDISESKVAEQKIKGYVKDLENAMHSTLQAIAKVVEAHDPYTAGHEWRVGVISGDIAREMGWSEERSNTLHLIGLVHDIGKMSIPAEILSKPGRLSAIEFELVKTHAEQGYNILKDVKFPLPIAQIIREHHERMDGSGYPQGLKGEEILPEARILAVADVLESMASNRPYRRSLGLEAALKEIETYRVQQFDPEVVDALLRLFREKGYQLPD